MDEAAEDIRRVLTIVYRGLESLSPHDLERTLSFDMEWIAPHEAEKAVKALVVAGWLHEANGLLSPSVSLGEVTVPFGWFPRPNRLLSPVPANQAAAPQPNVQRGEGKAQATAPEVGLPVTMEAGDETGGDPRAKLTQRVVRFIARQSGLEVEELHRRAQRKQAAFDLITPWLAYALVAREQGLPMNEIVDALAVV
jgi:hypothetical protein